MWPRDLIPRDGKWERDCEWSRDSYFWYYVSRDGWRVGGFIRTGMFVGGGILTSRFCIWWLTSDLDSRQRTLILKMKLDMEERQSLCYSSSCERSSQQWGTSPRRRTWYFNRIPIVPHTRYIVVHQSHVGIPFNAVHMQETFPKRNVVRYIRYHNWLK